MLEFRAIKKHIGFTLDASFVCDSGMVTTLFGKSGSGKTSIINMIAGLQTPDEGRISVGSKLLFDSYQRINIPTPKRHAGYIFQDGRLFPHMTVKSNLRYGLRNESTSTEEFTQIIDLLGISELLERRPHKLSGGEKQRVAIGRALLSSPDFMLMDEPLSALDTARKQELIPFIGRMVEKFHMPVVYVTHSLDELLALGDNVVLMDDGNCVDSGSVEDVVSKPENMSTLGLTGRVTVLRAEAVGAHETSSIIRLENKKLLIPTSQYKKGTKLRVTLHSEDVTLSVQKPTGLSSRNIIKGTIQEISVTPDGAMSVKIDIGVTIYATVTQEAVNELALSAGTPVYIIVKTIAMSRQSTATIRQ
ncbi:molybdate ABC transporter, ATPase subunit [Denitrovibrio acetiphilus DSM 12809]|jgi:molybdate transport system ATP-binding protein|uniref:Molybdate ABC transporter, ATPase subunit n=1 Tax=Denitrovibrio acetiphilus (strain DSM 12809 / NBRC 114555 / N2460) TaxID=522772 RepID=D4H8Q6_DENA2|nr:molybdenum ABC transporter ATP-binding protein [Denitrovibrio acetiphilus]ADD68405.1 molybdate ABC transporter, ATPase subunit [Denitrovibrio acetiphilus DSM 12809]